MKLQCMYNNTKKPAANYKFQVQVKGQNSGYLTLTTDANGYFYLDDKYQGQEIAYLDHGSVSGSYMKAEEGAKLYITAKQPVT